MGSNQNISRNRPPDQPPGIASGFAAGHLLPIAVLVIISLAVYANSLSNGFVFDDYAVIVENKHLKNLSHSLPAFFSDAYFTIAGGEASYRPVATLSYFLIHSFIINLSELHILKLIQTICKAVINP